MRFLVNIILVFALFLTSHSMANARSAATPADRMVICVGQHLVVVYVDEDGQPVESPQFCPDCYLQAVPAPMMPGAVRPTSYFDAQRVLSIKPALISLNATHDFLARAPPLGA